MKEKDCDFCCSEVIENLYEDSEEAKTQMNSLNKKAGFSKYFIMEYDLIRKVASVETNLPRKHCHTR